MRSSNPAALAWALVLGHEARATEADEREVKQMEASMCIIRDCKKSATGSLLVCGDHNDADTVRRVRETDSWMERIGILSLADVRQKDARIAELEAQLHDYIEKHAVELAKNDRLQKKLAAAQERERVYQEVYGDLPDDIESTYRRQEREIAALRAKLAALAAAQQEVRND